MELIQKYCSKCSLTKTAEQFSQSKKNKDGLYAYCRQCDAQRRRAHSVVNAEKEREYRKQKRAANPELFRKRSRESRKKWEQENPERAKEIRNASLRRTYQKNKEKRYARVKKWRQAHKETVNALNRLDHYKRRDAGGAYTVEEWNNLCAAFGHKCVCCGHKRKLTIDHIIPITQCGTNHISNLQPLCQSCNSRKNNREIIDYRLKWKKV